MTEKYNQTDVKGHNFILDPYFEEWGNGDWEKGEPNKYTKKKDGDRTYLYISGKGSVSQSVCLPKKSSGKADEPPFYSLTFDYSVKNKAKVSLILTYLSGGSERDKKEITLEDTKAWSQHEFVSWGLPEGDHHRDAVSFDPETPVALDLSGTEWEFSYTEEETTQFDLVLNSRGGLNYKIPCHIFSDEKYLEKNQCVFMLNNSVIVPGIEYNELEYKKEISLKLKLSREVSAFLDGMVLALVVHKMDGESDSLIITSDEKIIVDENKSDLEWTIETNVAVGHSFTLEIVLENLKNIRSVMKFTSV